MPHIFAKFFFLEFVFSQQLEVTVFFDKKISFDFDKVER